MRKIIEAVVVWLSAIMLAGCSKNEAVTPAALTGKWQLLSDDTYQGELAQPITWCIITGRLPVILNSEQTANCT